jgi:hypothetical protein
MLLLASHTRLLVAGSLESPETVLQNEVTWLQWSQAPVPALAVNCPPADVRLAAVTALYPLFSEVIADCVR